MRYNRSSVSAKVGASVLALVAAGLTASGAFAGVNYNSSKSNTGNVAAGPGLNCPTGQIVSTNPTTGKQTCVMPSTLNYNASKSNTGGGEGPCPTCAKCVNPKGCS